MNELPRPRVLAAVTVEPAAAPLLGAAWALVSPVRGEATSWDGAGGSA
ncbi:hypothetical protein [Crossiella equi]|nr:hypothetical protein [Crossiella equi]